MTQPELEQQIDRAVQGFCKLEGVNEDLANHLVGEGYLSYDDLSVIEPDDLMRMGELTAEQVDAIVEQAEGLAEEAEKREAEEKAAQKQAAEQQKRAAAAEAAKARAEAEAESAEASADSADAEDGSTEGSGQVDGDETKQTEEAVAEDGSNSSAAVESKESDSVESGS